MRELPTQLPAQAEAWRLVMTSRLFYQADGDLLFWDRENPGAAEDVSDYRRFREAAELRGIRQPLDAIGYDKTRDPDVQFKQPVKLVRASDLAGSIIDAEVTSVNHTMAKAITDSYKRWQRKPADLYPTPVDGTESIIPALKTLLPNGGRIWEPACGDGRLARVLEWHGYEVIATDLREYPGWGTGGLDFLHDDPLEKWGWDIGHVDAIITNPPFSLAEDFIRKARTVTPNVFMLLKQTYWNTKGRMALWDDHMPSMELKLTWRLAFLKEERGNSPLMDCMWVVWTNENDSAEDRFCVCEPIKRLNYQGYAGTGLKPALQILEGELDELTGALRGLL